MRIKINGKPEEIEAKTVLELLRAKEIEPRMVSVELNSIIVDREAYAATSLKEGDLLEFLFFMGGGGSFYPASKASDLPAGRQGGGGRKFPAGKFSPIYDLRPWAGNLVTREWQIANKGNRNPRKLQWRGRREPL